MSILAGPFAPFLMDVNSHSPSLPPASFLCPFLCYVDSSCLSDQSFYQLLCGCFGKGWLVIETTGVTKFISVLFP